MLFNRHTCEKNVETEHKPEHDEDPDSPRSPQAPTAAAAAPHSMQPAQSPGYHSNSDYRPSAVNHHVIDTYRQMANRCGLARARKIQHTQSGMWAHSFILWSKCVRMLRRAHFHTSSKTVLSLFSQSGSAKYSSLRPNLPP